MILLRITLLKIICLLKILFMKIQKALFWLRKSAEAGNVEAQSNLGQLYYFDKNFFDAAFWLLQAAKQGLPSAQNNLAVMYFDGLGVEQNRERALFWLQKAAEQGDPNAVKNLVMLQADKQDSSSDTLLQDDSQEESLPASNLR